ncbi:cytochrome oxidase complex assembly protein 1-domain-containing protein [Myxozyma melibiosi]|uniref:Cytochrome oxidase complex assembly protein 1-domain-containing protein n=1 Tax=Myxozyma melibiosi TaxID=54550 RepID=A0ABR1F3S8_9ASCO
MLMVQSPVFALSARAASCSSYRGLTGIISSSSASRYSTSTPTPPTSPSSVPPLKRMDRSKVKITVDTELPDVRPPRLVLHYTIFFAVIAVASLGFFNYGRQQSPLVASALYSARRSPSATEALGSNIRFRDSFPWISGSIDLLKGYVEVSFSVIGSKGVPATLHFKSTRKHKREQFVMEAWELVFDDGRTINLLEEDDEEPELALEQDKGQEAKA